MTTTRNDAGICEDVLLELKSDPKISSDNDIAVLAKDGIVALTGFVSSFWEKDAAEEAAKRVYAVKGVADDIEVKPFWKSTDPGIARNVIRELKNHVCIRADMVKVTVTDGWVTLEGYVDGEYERSVATSAVKRLKIGVTNKVQERAKVILQKVKGNRSLGLRGFRGTN